MSKKTVNNVQFYWVQSDIFDLIVFLNQRLFMYYPKLPGSDAM